VSSGHCPYGNRCRFIHPPSTGAQWSSSWSEDDNQTEIPYPQPEEDLNPTLVTDTKPITTETVEEKEGRLSFFRRLAS